jgi:hypothetical protein
MGLGTVSAKAAPRVQLRHGEGSRDHLTSLGGLAALSLDALSSVAYVAVSLAAGAASLASAFPPLAHHLLVMCLAGLVLITAVNLWGIAESARVLMLPMVAFLAAIFGVIAVGLARSHPAAVVGTPQPVRISEALGVVVVLKAFAAGCSALTGIEAIANGVPDPAEPAGPAPGDGPACQHRRRHLHHPLPAQHAIANPAHPSRGRVALAVLDPGKKGEP